MKKMIEKYNSIFSDVLNQIKADHASLVSELETTNTELSKNLEVAAKYKEQINVSKELIETSEKDIKGYEKDLEDLTNKFNETDFSELVSVGKKEFNNKITAKKTVITSECNKIQKLSIETQSLKEVLLSLKEQKEELESEISDISILEKYYNEKTNEMIEYTNNNVEELLLVNNKIDINLSSDNEELTESDLNIKLDDSIFDEIENISVDDIDSVEIKDIKLDLDNDAEEVVDPSDNLNDYLNSMISMEQLIVEKASGYMIDIDPVVESEPSVTQVEDIFNSPVVETTPIETEETNVIEPTIEPISNTMLNSDTIEPYIPVVEEENDTNNEMFDNLFTNIVPVEETNNIVEEQTEEDEEPNTEINDILSNIQSDVDNEVEEENDSLELSNEEFANIAPIDDIFATRVNPVVDPNQGVAASTTIETLKELGFEPNNFGQDNLNQIENIFDRESMVKLIDVLNKHNIDKSILYTNTNILLNMSADSLDHILELLETASASTEDIKRVFGKLDRVIVDKLESLVKEASGDDIINILYASMLYKGELDLVKELNLSAEDERKLKAIAGNEEFKVMNLFPEIVIANYNTIKDLGVDVNECFINHPHRFLYNTDRFNAILDKYDRDDLIRCINKNSAVIDKL